MASLKKFLGLKGMVLFTALFVWMGSVAPAAALSHLEEKEMGEKVLEQVKQHFNLVEDPLITSYINSLGQKILTAIGPQPFDYHFYVIESGAINAFATPGGYIFVFTGLITAVENEGQLAAVICHEIGHVTSRHIAKRYEKSKGLTVAALAGAVAGALVGGPIGSAMVVGSMAGGATAQLSYSREDEREADSKGLEYLVRAGYDPRYMAQTFKVFLKNSWRSNNAIAGYLTTHPGSPERIANVENTIMANPGLSHQFGRGDDSAFNAVRNRLLATTKDPRSARHFFNQEIKHNPRNAWAYHGLALICLQEQDYEQATSLLRQALALEPANSGVLTDLGQVLFLKKEYNEALTVLSKALVLKPNAVQTLFLLGRTYEEMGVASRARELYERTLIQDPAHLDVLYRLSVLYGQQGDLAQAHLMSGLYFEKVGQPEEAMFHLKRAKDAAGGATPKVRGRIDDALDRVGELEKDGTPHSAKRGGKKKQSNQPPRIRMKF